MGLRFGGFLGFGSLGVRIFVVSVRFAARCSLFTGLLVCLVVVYLMFHLMCLGF